MTMAEYIEREALIQKIDEGFDKTDPCGEEQIGFLKCRRIVREIPAADVAPVRHGVWERIPGIPYPRCSLCLVMTHWNNFVPRYCDACGAKMDGDTGAP